MLNKPEAYIISFEEVAVRSVVVTARCPVSALVEAEKRKNTEAVTTIVKNTSRIDVSSIEEVVAREEVV